MTDTATKDPIIAIKEMADKFATLQDSQAAIQKTLAALEGSIHTATGEVIREGAEGVNASLADSGIAGTMDKLTGWKMFEIPVGAAVVGGVAGVFITELTDGLCVKFNIKSPYIAGAIKLGEAAAICKWGKKFVGKDTANIIALLLTFDAVVNDFAPQLFNGINGFTNKLTGTTTAAGLSPKYDKAFLGAKGNSSQSHNSAVAQAATVAAGYYAKAGL